MDFAVSDHGKIGLFGARSNEIVEIKDCLIADERMKVAELANRSWRSNARVEIAVSSSDEVSVIRSGRSISGPTQLVEQVGENSFKISPISFWQSHKAAAALLVSTVLASLEIRKTDHICDLYAGVGLFAAALVKKLDSSGQVSMIESDKNAVADARKIFANNYHQ